MQAEGRDAPHTHGITSTSNYVFANGDTGQLLILVKKQLGIDARCVSQLLVKIKIVAGSGRSSTEPNQDDPSPAQSPSIKFDGSRLVKAILDKFVATFQRFLSVQLFSCAVTQRTAAMVGCSALRLLALAMALICLGNNLTHGRRI